MELKACLGGWCRRRQNCANYHADDRSDPAERLCEPGHDGQGIGEYPVRIYRPAGTWERERLPSSFSPASPFPVEAAA
jgi:hypothetical protein